MLAFVQSVPWEKSVNVLGYISDVIEVAKYFLAHPVHNSFCIPGWYLIAVS